jgi:RimJ/RimL family protein N-acetyltransferase
LRLDRTSGDADQPIYEVSILTAPDRRRQGLAKAVLALAQRLLVDGELDAEVLPDNVASHTLFTAAGFDARGDRYVYAAGTGS